MYNNRRSTTPTTLEEARKEFEKVSSQIDSLLYLLGDDCNNVRYEQNNLDEQFMKSQFYSIADKLEDIKEKIDYLMKPVVEQGFLKLNEGGRYELPSGHYFTSGSTCELLVTDRDNEQYWIHTSIEHSSDYYATVLGEEKSLNGMMARIRR
jgi:Domain of unknown function (DUF5348)